MNALLLCLSALSMLRPSAVTPERWDTCIALVEEAEAQGVPPHVVLAVGFVESRYSADAVSPAGARGPLQVLPKYFCDGGTHEGCDLIKAGVAKLRRDYTKYKSWTLVWCHYSAGVRCTERGRQYADKVGLRYEVLTTLLLARGVWADAGLYPPKKL